MRYKHDLMQFLGALRPLATIVVVLPRNDSANSQFVYKGIDGDNVWIMWVDKPEELHVLSGLCIQNLYLSVDLESKCSQYIRSRVRRRKAGENEYVKEDMSTTVTIFSRRSPINNIVELLDMLHWDEVHRHLRPIMFIAKRCIHCGRLYHAPECNNRKCTRRRNE